MGEVLDIEVPRKPRVNNQYLSKSVNISCKMSLSKTYWFKNTTLYFTNPSVDQQFGLSSSGWFPWAWLDAIMQSQSIAMLTGF